MTISIDYQWHISYFSTSNTIFLLTAKKNTIYVNEGVTRLRNKPFKKCPDQDDEKSGRNGVPEVGELSVVDLFLPVVIGQVRPGHVGG